MIASLFCESVIGFGMHRSGIIRIQNLKKIIILVILTLEINFDVFLLIRKLRSKLSLKDNLIKVVSDLLTERVSMLFLIPFIIKKNREKYLRQIKEAFPDAKVY